jgi:deazaflavin-dependent oxidoreductase (nitroreductase family)
MPVVMLATTGRNSGKRRLTMLCTPLQIGDTVILVGANAGDERHPAWYRNLCANPQVELTARGHTRRMLARTALGDERTGLWARIADAHSSYARSGRRTVREIPVVILEPRP